MILGTVDVVECDWLQSTMTFKRPRTRRRQLLRRWLHRMAEARNAPMSVNVGGRLFVNAEMMKAIYAGTAKASVEMGRP